jgi:hypothetical protein
LANYLLINGRIKEFVPTPTLILVLVPMFLILSSSVYPAIMSSMENKEMQIISKVLAQLEDKNSLGDSSGYHANIPISEISSTSLSPTPTTSAPSAMVNADTYKREPHNITKLNLSQQQGEKEDNAVADRSSIDSGSSEEEQLQLDDAVDNELVASVINPGEQVHTIWGDTTGGGDDDIFYKRDGADFDPTTEDLSNNEESSFSPAIAVSGNNVHVAWSDNTFGITDILYKRSIDSGATFSDIINLSDNGGSSSSPQIAVSGNNVHVVWHDDTSTNLEILYRRSTDGGASFEASKNLSGNVGISFSPAIAVSGSTIHVVWNDDTPTNFDIFYRRSTNNGAAFHPIKNLSANTGDSNGPSIAASGNNVHVVWHDITSTNLDILYRRSLDNGNTFPNVIKNLSSNAGVSLSPSIAVSGNNVHVVWSDDTPGTFDILYRRSLDNGNTFPNVIKDLSSNSEVAELSSTFAPDITTSDNNLYVVWQFNPGTGDSEIVYRTSANNGNTFPPDLTNLSANNGDSFSPQIAAS